jgi:hypothetical protein
LSTESYLRMIRFSMNPFIVFFVAYLILSPCLQLNLVRAKQCLKPILWPHGPGGGGASLRLGQVVSPQMKGRFFGNCRLGDVLIHHLFRRLASSSLFSQDLTGVIFRGSIPIYLYIFSPVYFTCPKASFVS